MYARVRDSVLVLNLALLTGCDCRPDPRDVGETLRPETPALRRGDGVITPTEAGAAAPIAAALVATAGVYAVALRFEAPTCFFDEPGKPR
jgi:hypothetical protein